MINHLWQSTLFAVAAGLLTLAFRSNRAAVRYWMWFAASAKFFLPFALLIGIGGLLPKPASPPPISSAVERIAEPMSVSFVPDVPRRGVDWLPVALLTAWAAGALLVAAIRLRGWLRVRAAVRASVRLEIAAAVEVRSAPGLLEPGVVGLWRPVLLLPAGIVGRLTAGQLESVLAHELCHVRRRDNLLSAIHMAVEAVFWFHPLVWWIGARLVEERERACDEEVLSIGSAPHQYAEAILNVCKYYVESPLACVSGVTGADLKKRIEAIMTQRLGFRLNGAKKGALALAGAIAMIAPIGVGVLHVWPLLAQPQPPAVASPQAQPSPKPASVAAVEAQAPAPQPQNDLARLADFFRFYPEPPVAALSIDPLSRIEVRYGPPSRKEKTGEVETWTYDYLQAFHSKVVFEYHPGDRGFFPRITYPLPTVYDGQPSDPSTMPGLPGKHTAFLVYPVPEYHTLSVPLDGLSGQIVIDGRIARRDSERLEAGLVHQVYASVESAAGTFTVNFVLEPGSYVCHLVVTERATGRVFGETISFEAQ